MIHRLLIAVALLSFIGCSKPETAVYGVWEKTAGSKEFVTSYNFASDHTGTKTITVSGRDMGADKLKWEMLDNGKVKVTLLNNKDSFDLFHFSFTDDRLLSENDVPMFKK